MTKSVKFAKADDFVEWLKDNAVDMHSDGVLIFEGERLDESRRSAIDAHLDRVHGGPPSFAVAHLSLPYHDVWSNDPVPTRDREDGVDVWLSGNWMPIRNADGSRTALGESFTRSRTFTTISAPNDLAEAVFVPKGGDPDRSARVFERVAKATRGQVSVVGDPGIVARCVTGSQAVAAPEDAADRVARKLKVEVEGFDSERHDPPAGVARLIG